MAKTQSVSAVFYNHHRFPETRQEAKMYPNARRRLDAIPETDEDLLLNTGRDDPFVIPPELRRPYAPSRPHEHRWSCKVRGRHYHKLSELVNKAEAELGKEEPDETTLKELRQRMRTARLLAEQYKLSACPRREDDSVWTDAEVEELHRRTDAVIAQLDGRLQELHLQRQRKEAASKPTVPPRRKWHEEVSRWKLADHVALWSIIFVLVIGPLLAWILIEIFG